MDIVKRIHCITVLLSRSQLLFSVLTNTDKNTISDICDYPRQIQRYSFNGKQFILVCCCNNWIRFYGSVSLLLLPSCITYLSPSVLSIFFSSTPPEKVIHRSGNLAVFSLSPASSPSVTWPKTDVGVINRRQRKPCEPPQYHSSPSLWCLVQQHCVTDNFSIPPTTLLHNGSSN